MESPVINLCQNSESEAGKTSYGVLLENLDVPIVGKNTLYRFQYDVLGYTLCKVPSKKAKSFPYSIPSVGPGADPGVQAVSLQVAVKSSSRR